MPVFKIESVDDPRLAPYRQLPKTKSQGELFIAEGYKLVERLLESRFQTHSILVEERLAEQFARQAPPETPIFVATKQCLEKTVGFHFHRGVLACGVRPENSALRELFPEQRREMTAVVLPHVQDAENVGGILRSSAAFGVDTAIIGPASSDPYSRRVLRVSMGAPFKLPIRLASDLAADLRQMKEVFGFQHIATVLDENAELLETAQRDTRTALLFGSEGDGLDAQWLEFCERRVAIPMQRGVDSLNVSVAAGIFLHHFTRKRRGSLREPDV